jgi:hypothetical protein
MTIHKLSARDGYTYLTRQVASADEQRAGQDLAGYYTATGTPPGRWTGAGAAHLGVRGEVTETQMRALFGTGLHPDADAIITALTAAGATPEPAVPTWRPSSGRPGRKRSGVRMFAWMSMASTGPSTPR